MLLLIAVLALVVGFRGALLELVQRWTRQEEYSHGFLIVVVAAWLLWTRRHALVASIGRPSWLGFLLILAAMAMNITGELSAIFILSQLGFILALFGTMLGIGGYSLLRVTILPIAFLMFAIPMPYFVDAILTLQLQLISSELGTFFIRIFQIPVYLDGNVIDLGNYKLQVVEACSGLRYLYPLLSLSFLAAYLFQAPIWQRAIVFLSAIPITIVMNGFRIGVVGVLTNRWGPQQADGFVHLFEGWIIFIACAAILFAEIFVLVRISSKRIFDSFYAPRIKPKLPPAVDSGSAGTISMTSCVALLVVGALGVSFVSGRSEIVPERPRFATFPRQLGQWHGRTATLEPDVERGLKMDDYILSDYSGPDRKPVNLYVAYYASQRKGESPHSPIVCIPGGGWQIVQFDRLNDRGLTDEPPFNRAIIARSSIQQVVYYWFDERGQPIANEWWAKWRLLTDAIFKNRTDGALVRLTTQILPGETEQEADQRLHSFMREVVSPLRAYLPSDVVSEVKSTLYLPSR